MALSSAQLDAYERDGFIILEQLFDAEALARWSKRFEDLVLGNVPAPERLVVMKDVMVVKGAVEPPTPLHAINKILSFEDDPVLWEYAIHEPLLAAVRDLVAPDLVTISTNVFNKPPGIDGRHPLHQDLRYFALRPAEKIIGTWTAIDRTTRENGCLAVIPGSHREPLRDHANPDWEYVNFGFFAARDVGPGGPRPCRDGARRHAALPPPVAPRQRPEPQPGLPPRDLGALRPPPIANGPTSRARGSPS